MALGDGIRQLHIPQTLVVDAVRAHHTHDAQQGVEVAETLLPRLRARGEVGEEGGVAKDAMPQLLLLATPRWGGERGEARDVLGGSLRHLTRRGRLLGG